ncbi:MAG: right-handed parallel beta-helix repeat-containing protein [Phycisphaerales bacterium]|nr:right-handed parallel beta-helix repeat-containing protein [Phycisphaerales bacterium]
MLQNWGIKARTVLALAFCALTANITAADTLHVPSEYPTIQAAIDASTAGDIIEIADGTYTGEGNRELDFGGRAVTVRSASGDPNLCIIDCESGWRGFNFRSGEGPDSVVEGLTITRGFGPSIGAGLYCIFSSPTLRNCIISECYTHGGAGAGVYCFADSSPTFIKCSIRDNYSDLYGGGMILYYNCNPTLIDCAISGNSGGDGGGVACYDSSPTFINCTIIGNDGDDGGGVFVHTGSPTFTNCTLSGNSADEGAAIFVYYGSPTLTNCTLSGNTASDNGGGVYCGGNTVEMHNLVLWGNSPEQVFLDGGDAELSYCDVQGGWAGVGNIDADPLFADPDGPDDDPDTWQDNDYRLGPGSPCIDAADNAAVPADTFDVDDDGDETEPLPFDLDGNARFVDDPGTADTGNGAAPIVDMGAYEFQGASPCAGDLDGDGDTDQADLGILLGSYGLDDGGDLDGDGDTDQNDLGILLADWDCG